MKWFPIWTSFLEDWNSFYSGCAAVGNSQIPNSNYSISESHTHAHSLSRTLFLSFTKKKLHFELPFQDEKMLGKWQWNIRKDALRTWGKVSVYWEMANFLFWALQKKGDYTSHTRSEFVNVFQQEARNDPTQVQNEWALEPRCLNCWQGDVSLTEGYSATQVELPSINVPGAWLWCSIGQTEPLADKCHQSHGSAARFKGSADWICPIACRLPIFVLGNAFLNKLLHVSRHQ